MNCNGISLIRNAVHEFLLLLVHDYEITIVPFGSEKTQSDGVFLGWKKEQ